MLSKLAIFLIRIYQLGISPYIPRRCRFYPSCSEYGKECYIKFSFFKATWYCMKRILKCHPFHPGGVDPLI